jgi:hypothetical protein
MRVEGETVVPDIGRRIGRVVVQRSSLACSTRWVDATPQIRKEIATTGEARAAEAADGLSVLLTFTDGVAWQSKSIPADWAHGRQPNGQEERYSSLDDGVGWKSKLGVNQ